MFVYPLTSLLLIDVLLRSTSPLPISTTAIPMTLYATMLFPIVALGISTVYEGYQWAAHNLIGMAVVLIGNWLVLNKKAMAKTTLAGKGMP